MSNQIQVPTREQLDAKGQNIFDNINKQLGTVPNLYATIAYSSDALENFLGFNSKAGNSSFTKKEKDMTGKLIIAFLAFCFSILIISLYILFN